ncbi:MAG: methyltransferase domain-containing protein [Phreatobacter sp.]|jgi:ubiquinone/menaquinone biosynthesis C-methylase UbiE|nr:methyltransferase domain-containing protein [Phreatobacter sp.]
MYGGVIRQTDDQHMTYTPAAGYHWLSPLYDLGVASLTREKRWRRALIAQVGPDSRDIILDVGCGTGSLLVLLGKAAPSARLIGIDPDPAMLARARKKAETAGVRAEYHLGLARQAVELLGAVRPTKIVSSLVLHQVSLEEKAASLAAMSSALEPGGHIHIADYGLQRTPLMRTLFRASIQNLDGRANTEPNAKGALLELMRSAGLREVEETLVIPTVSGSVSLYRGRR